MGISYNPRIVTDGLVLALDAGNTKGFDDDENLMTNSQLGTTILNDGGGVTLTTDTTIVNPFEAYDGVLKCVHTTNTPGYFRRGQNMSLTAGVTYTFSVFFKNGTVANPYGVANPNNGPGLQVTTFTPTFQELNTSLNTNIPFPNGWYRQVFTFTPSYTQTYQVDFNQTVNQTPIGTYYLYGFQLETGSSASPYYATTASAKNRGTTLIDMTGRGNTGTLTNGPTYNSSNGGSIVFDGTNDYISLPTNFINWDTGNPLTISVWFKTTSTGIILGQQNNPTPNSASGYIPAIYVDINGLLRTSCFYSGFVQTSVSSSAVNNGSWNNITVTFLSGTQTSYLNGISYATLSQTQQSYSATYYYFLGSGQVTNWTSAPASPYFNGSISNFSYYTRALSAAEIQQNFNTLRGRYGI